MGVVVVVATRLDPLLPIRTASIALQQQSHLPHTELKRRHSNLLRQLGLNTELRLPHPPRSGPPSGHQNPSPKTDGKRQTYRQNHTSGDLNGRTLQETLRLSHIQLTQVHFRDTGTILTEAILSLTIGILATS